jgi:hypothetical protein
MNFCIWIDREKGIAKYLPLPTRVQLSTGRPLREKKFRNIGRRDLTEDEMAEEEQKKADLDEDLADKSLLPKQPSPPPDTTTTAATTATTSTSPATNNKETGPSTRATAPINDEDGEDEFGDDDDSSDSGDGTYIESLFFSVVFVNRSQHS